MLIVTREANLQLNIHQHWSSQRHTAHYNRILKIQYSPIQYLWQQAAVINVNVRLVKFAVENVI